MTDPAASAAARLASVADAYWDAELAWQPLAATNVGVRTYDDRLDDLTPAGRDAHAADLRSFQARLAELEGVAGDLSPEDRVTASALREQLDSDLAGLASDLDAWTVDPLEGPQVEIFNIPAYQPVVTPEDGDLLLRRWQDIGRYLDEYVANLRTSLAGGRVAVAAPVDRVVDALDGLLAQPDDAWALLDPAREPHDDWPAPRLAAFRAGLFDSVEGVARPALARVRDVLREEVRPRARSNERPGVMHLPGGDAVYRNLIRLHTSLERSPEELHATGLSEVARINGELETLGESVLGIRDRAAILSRLRGDPVLHFATSPEIAAKAESALARARAAIPDWFGILPRAGCAVVEMGEHEAKHGTVAYYRQPNPDGSRPGQYSINTSAPHTRPRYEAEALAYHESIPGHHLQIAIAQEIAGLPEFRKHGGVTAFWEGWGLYAERLADEIGLYTGDLDRMGMLSLDAWRACRLVVDTGMHAFGWTRQQAIDFMVANTVLARNNIVNEVDRYIVWPGQALAYKAGQLEILAIRRDARARLGRDFDIRRFHDAVLVNGALPLETLREVVLTALASD